MITAGYAVAMAGIALCVLLCGLGSSLGLFKTVSAAAGVTGEEPKRYKKIVPLVLLPATQGLYGFLISIMAPGSLAMDMTLAQGFSVFGALLPMMLSGLITGILQGKASANCIYAVGKQESLSMKLFLFPAMIEFYAILGLVISIVLL